MNHITIVIPTFADGDLLIKCVNSVRTSKHILSFQIEDNNPYNYGFSYAINRGIEKGMEAKSEYFLLLNADTELSPDCLDTLVSELDRTGWYLVTGTTGEASQTLTDAVNGACMLITRKTVEDIGLLDENIFPLGPSLECEDYFMRIKQKQVGLQGKSMGKCNWATFTHYEAHSMKTVDGFSDKYKAQFNNNLAYFAHKWNAYPEKALWREDKFSIPCD